MAVSNIILWDGPSRENLLPFTYTRPVADIRVGILTIREKYEYYFKTKTSFLTQNYLAQKFPTNIEADNLLLNAAVIPNAELLQALLSLQNAQTLWQGDDFIAGRFDEIQIANYSEYLNINKISYSGTLSKLDAIWKIFLLNDQEIKSDFKLITQGRTSQKIHESNFVLGSELIFIEEGAHVYHASLNASTGPIYIGKDAEVMEGALIRGPFALGEHSTLKLGAKIYGATTIGPHCKVGGEVSNSVFFGLSNKAHDGFIGNAVIGEWCNIGADSNNSNLKNNYEEVKVWSFAEKTFVKTGLQFCGLFLGDHSKCGINTMFNTGTVVGVSSNIFGGGFPRTFIPSFSWGGASGLTDYKIDKAFETAAKVMERRGLVLDAQEKSILTHIYTHYK
jgi:UDP-N-acetylglucosamine diphosphorylase/glucosamine-1-phosphate N-acetyltransferase